MKASQKKTLQEKKFNKKEDNKDIITKLSKINILESCWTYKSKKFDKLSFKLLNLNKYFMAYKCTKEDVLPPDYIKDRKFFKQLVMSRAYGAGNKANMKHVATYLKNIFPQK